MKTIALLLAVALPSCAGVQVPTNVSVQDVAAFADVTCQDFLDNSRPDAPSTAVQHARRACETVIAASKVLPAE